MTECAPTNFNQSGKTYYSFNINIYSFIWKRTTRELYIMSVDDIPMYSSNKHNN